MTELLELKNVQAVVDAHRRDKVQIGKSLESLAGCIKKLTDG
jgi:hypothetical protein